MSEMETIRLLVKGAISELTEEQQARVVGLEKQLRLMLDEEGEDVFRLAYTLVGIDLQ